MTNVLVDVELAATNSSGVINQHTQSISYNEQINPITFRL